MKTNQSSSFDPRWIGGIGGGPEEGTGPSREQDGEEVSKWPFEGQLPDWRAEPGILPGSIFYLLALRPKNQGEPIESN